MFRLKFIPRLARFLSPPLRASPPSLSPATSRLPHFSNPDWSHFRSLASSSRPGPGRGEDGVNGGPGNRKEDDSDFLSKYLQEGAATDEQFVERFFHEDKNRGGGAQQNSSRGGRRRPRSAGPGRGYGASGGRGYGERPGRPGYEDERERDERRRFAGDGKDEEEMKLKKALEADEEQVEKVEEEEEEEEEVEEGKVRSIYTGYIAPEYDDLQKEHRQHLKRLMYKDKVHRPSKFVGEDEEEMLDDLDEDSDEERDQRKRRGRRDAVDVKGRQVEEVSDDETAEDEVDEEEWDAISKMENDEFERHLKRRENAKVLRQEYFSRIQALGDKVSDPEEVRKVQDHMLRKWRLQDKIPRLVTPMEKEEMWKRHKEDPQEWTVEKLAKEYNVCKARVHAILWLWEMRKQGGEEVRSAEEETKEYLDSLAFDSDGQPCPPPHMGEDKWVTTWNTKPNYKIMPEDWEGSVRTEEEAIEEASSKEEAMMLEEFERRMEFNKLQIAGFVKQHLYARRRPVEGWSYIVEKLGPEGKRGKGGAYRFVATADGKHRKLNEVEKLFLKRETVRPRRRVL